MSAQTTNPRVGLYAMLALWQHSRLALLRVGASRPSRGGLAGPAPLAPPDAGQSRGPKQEKCVRHDETSCTGTNPNRAARTESERDERQGNEADRRGPESEIRSLDHVIGIRILPPSH